MMKRIKYLLLTYTALFISLLAIAQVEHPNILIIQVDDMGFDDLSVNGNTVSRTPNIDRLSTESVRFSNFMLNSVCAPSRASLLTGRDFWRTGVSAMHGGRDFLNLDETTFASILQNDGYKTGMWGKWHSGKSDGYWPWDRGFDEAYYSMLYHYYPSHGYLNSPDNHITHDGKWSAEVITNYAIDFIDKNKDEPFLAYVSYLTCHEKWKAPEAYIKKYRQKGITEHSATLLAMLEYMDENVGRLLNFLTKSGNEKNTVIMFLSDNGPNFDNQNPQEWALRNNHSFLGNKARLWQNGLKSPLYIKYEGVCDPTDINSFISITDIFPSILDITNTELPNNNKLLDGHSIEPFLLGINDKEYHREAIFSHWFPSWNKDQFQPVPAEARENMDVSDQCITIINDHYKLLHNPVNVNGSPQKYNSNVLIDLKNDPMERTNVAEQNSAIVDEMMNNISQWFDEIKHSSGAFTAPVFQVAWNGKQTSKILGYCPSKTVGVKNHQFYVDNIDSVGNRVEYNIKVHKEGLYKVSMCVKNPELDGITLNVGTNKNSSTVHLQNKKVQEIGCFQFDGRTTMLGLEIMRNNKLESFGQLQYLMLTRVEE